MTVIAGKLPDWASGSGYGSGYGSGSGSGYGYGSGSGDGSGSGFYWQAAIGSFASKWGAAQKARLAVLKKAGATIAYWRSRSDGKPANGGRAEPAYVGMVQEIAGPLELCGPRALHATLTPEKWKGERWWIVALIGEVIKQDDKMGALRREIIGEAL